jgi:hypothetical protein
MKTPMLAAVVFAPLAVACLETSESPSNVYPAELYPTELPPSWGPVAYPGGEIVSDQALTVSGQLEGTLRGIALSGETTQNYASFTAYEGSPAYFSASIAAQGDRGAGMLMINLTDPELRDKMLGGQWSGASPTGPYGDVSSNVASCAGPTLGEWPYEIGASDYEMEATEDPAEPGIVVLAVKAHFPRSESDSSSMTELTGTLRFPLPAAPD